MELRSRERKFLGAKVPVTVMSGIPVVNIYTVSHKTVQNYFCQNFVKFPPSVNNICTKMAKRQNLCEVYSFSTLPLFHVNTHHVKRRCSKLLHNAVIINQQ